MFFIVAVLSQGGNQLESKQQFPLPETATASTSAEHPERTTLYAKTISQTFRS